MGLGLAGQVGAPPALRPAGWVCLQEGGRPTPTPLAAPSFCLLRFLLSQRASLLLFGDGTWQVSARGALVPGGLCWGSPTRPDHGAVPVPTVGRPRNGWLWWGWG